MKQNHPHLSAGRETMIRDHLEARGISDPLVLRAMGEVPREDFVPDELALLAYEDRPLPIDEGQTISQPYIVAFMTESLELTGADRVLEIGTGSGYAAAVVGRIAGRVYTVERIPSLARQARQRLQTLNYRNIIVIEGDGSLGFAESAPYDAIVVTAGAPEVPRALLEQLAIGGRLVIPIGSALELQMLIRVRRLEKHKYHTEELCPVRFVPLIGAAGWHEH